jgi:hypothetical protein
VEELLERVRDSQSLERALASGARSIEIDGPISGLGAVVLPRGVSLRGAGNEAALRFRAGEQGIRLNGDHIISGLRIHTDADQEAVCLTDSQSDLGTIELRDLGIEGRLHLEAESAKSGNLVLSNIHIASADARGAPNRPPGFGVEVLAGAITIYNRSPDAASRWNVRATGLSAGNKVKPVRGSGVFIFGGATIPDGVDPSTAPSPTKNGGSIALAELTTGDVHSDGGIAKGTPDRITGGVFIGAGVEADLVANEGGVSTYGVNDMVLDNWGTVRLWVAEGSLTSYGDSGIGFVNFADIDALIVRGPVETHGGGARGYNLYDGSLKHAEFESITTTGEGSIGVQLSKPFGRLIVHGDIRTKGGEGPSLVRGKVITLKAHALSLKPGVQGDAIFVLGKAVAENPDISDFEFAAPASSIDLLMVDGKRVSDPS